MKIEKLNENQVKFILTREDLAQWDIKLTELTMGTDRTYELFHNMMDQALTQCDFRVDNTPLLIEAIPQSVDGIVIIVTKVANADEIDECFTFSPASKLLERFRAKTAPETKPVEKPEPLTVVSFAALDDVIAAAARLRDSYWGQSSLYRNESEYFLILEHDASSSRLNQADIEAVLAEYGEQRAVTVYSESYLAEHCEPIIKYRAVALLSGL